ncbi:MAG TPA: hypothetical protein VJA22_03115 [Patescibacteria group bacterium]|nr:hypothetical protein [Patescibacteria group bacterium]
MRKENEKVRVNKDRLKDEKTSAQHKTRTFNPARHVRERSVKIRPTEQEQGS